MSDLERSPTTLLYQQPAAGEWPVMSTLAHLEEMLPYWAQQAQAIAAAPGQPFGRTHDDPVRIGAVTSHGHDALEAIVPRIRDSLDECLRLLRGLPSEAWQATGLHPSRGSMSVSQVVDAFLVRHAEEHAAQVRAALAALGASTSS